MNNIDLNLEHKKAAAVRRYQGGYFKVLVSSDETNREMTLLEMTLPKGAEPPAHIHTREDETFYLQEGEMTFTIGEKVIKAEPGDVVFAPRQVAHHFVIDTPSVKFLNIISPGNLLGYFMEFSFPNVGELSIAPLQAPPPLEAIQRMTSQLTEEYGVLFI